MMIIDGSVVIAYVSGIIFISLATLLRYSVGTGNSGKVTRLIDATRAVGLREKTPDAFPMLIQYTGVLWLLLGTAYGIVLKRFAIEGILEDFLIFLVLIGPLTLLMGVVTFLRRFYWQR